ncbi:biliverdin reductase A [Esox lucius]|uniref:Biliverdin reductase A n=1 Tax=Esox lucius TaxID=8010 RepID=A0A3P9A475_ESOLU|nr:biliverdin reductase A [Esox lucius]
MFGSVVMGMGTVGAVRIRDILAPLPSSTAEKLSVKGFISRRILEEHQGVKQITFEDALSRDDIKVAFVCSENSAHEENVRMFLEAGKHVCIEYPMAMTHRTAVDLSNLAQEKGVVLHEEHIELLTAEYKQLKKDIAGKKLEEGFLHFTGGPLKPGFGFPSFSGIARLTWLVEMFGELRVTAASMVEDQEKMYTKMTAQLMTKDNKCLTWIEERGPGLPRAKNINFHFDSCTITQLPPAPREPVGLFMQDLVLFSQKLMGQVPRDQLHAERWRVLHCLELADRIQQLSEQSQGLTQDA